MKNKYGEIFRILENDIEFYIAFTDIEGKKYIYSETNEVDLSSNAGRNEQLELFMNSVFDTSSEGWKEIENFEDDKEVIWEGLELTGVKSYELNLGFDVVDGTTSNFPQNILVGDEYIADFINIECLSCRVKILNVHRYKDNSISEIECEFIGKVYSSTNLIYSDIIENVNDEKISLYQFNFDNGKNYRFIYFIDSYNNEFIIVNKNYDLYSKNGIKKIIDLFLDCNLDSRNHCFKINDFDEFDLDLEQIYFDEFI